MTLLNEYLASEINWHVKITGDWSDTFESAVGECYEIIHALGGKYDLIVKWMKWMK
jgi:hypothetical protein